MSFIIIARRRRVQLPGRRKRRQRVRLVGPFFCNYIFSVCFCYFFICLLFLFNYICSVFVCMFLSFSMARGKTQTNQGFTKEAIFPYKTTLLRDRCFRSSSKLFIVMYVYIYIYIYTHYSTL